jgi:hypothetical protein
MTEKAMHNCVSTFEEILALAGMVWYGMVWYGMVCQLGNFLFCCHPVAVWHHLGLVFLGNCGLLSSEKKVEGYL